MATGQHCDAVVVGGGFYGCCLALFLRSFADHVVIVEQEEELLSRASYVNQARIHTGFHYPRSFVTARRSLALYQRFMADFREAVVDDFSMLYAIARWGSKITAQRFVKMFESLGAPMEPASKPEHALFDPNLVAEGVRCREYAFDAVRLRGLLRERLDAAGVHVLTGTSVERIDPSPSPGPIAVLLAGGKPLAAPLVLDATYGQFANKMGGHYQSMPLKYELAEIALVEPPPELTGLGVTVMDGPFFSTMPFPARQCYSMTHVRYTPHRAWTSHDCPVSIERTDRKEPTLWLHMQRDAMRYMPVLRGMRPKGSLFEIKTVLMRNESDDGRPILLHRNAVNPNYMTVLGGKLDNIYDLFDALAALGPPFDRAEIARVTGSAS